MRRRRKEPAQAMRPARPWPYSGSDGAHNAGSQGVRSVIGVCVPKRGKELQGAEMTISSRRRRFARCGAWCIKDRGCRGYSNRAQLLAPRVLSRRLDDRMRMSLGTTQRIRSASDSSALRDATAHLRDARQKEAHASVCGRTVRTNRFVREKKPSPLTVNPRTEGGARPL